ncbi:MAG: UDP-N-acetylglucosamine--N-acetylmuramyl-(pentapeptide) pyrophosphoryl-undecaprenol N-acetylglucosamine transferase [Ardenticatenaceae bacterium]|nr:UDP-N-acetylglucosamine--N-acetylmuramyl-(pentapeptide) pyrophosphoryl-undecaprenol N-acetylglucosamine transferase [Ardenticatenaceae bacterium]
MKVLICAGGTGGGIYPALAAANALQELGAAPAQVRWVGTRGEMEEKLVPRAGYQMELIRGGAIVGVAPQVMMMNAAKLAWSFPAAVGLVRRFQPEAMLMTGGYMSVPVALACWLQRVPIAIYLPDVEPGKAIKSLIRFATKVACTTDGSRAYVPQEKMVVTGYPVRAEIRAARAMSKAEALAKFGLTTERPTVFVFGGSRGAWAINKALMAALPELLPTVQVIHISGTTTWPQVEAQAATLGEELKGWYRPFPYLHEEMGAAFRAADLVVARAGASMLGESPAFGLPSILVPLTFAWRYQKVNADYLTEHGAAVQLTDETLAEQLLPTIMELIHDQARLARMGAAATALDHPQATNAIAQLVLGLGQRS